MLVSTQHSLIKLWIIANTLFAGKSDIALQHTAVEPGGFVSEDTFLLVEAKKGSQHRGTGTDQSCCSIMIVLAA